MVQRVSSCAIRLRRNTGTLGRCPYVCSAPISIFYCVCASIPFPPSYAIYMEKCPSHLSRIWKPGSLTEEVLRCQKPERTRKKNSYCVYAHRLWPMFAGWVCASERCLHSKFAHQQFVDTSRSSTMSVFLSPGRTCYWPGLQQSQDRASCTWGSSSTPFSEGCSNLWGKVRPVFLSPHLPWRKRSKSCGSKARSKAESNKECFKGVPMH